MVMRELVFAILRQAVAVSKFLQQPVGDLNFLQQPVVESALLAFAWLEEEEK
jgi:hypothetical protein